MIAMVARPPERSSVGAETSDESERELHDPRSLERTMGEVAVIATHHPEDSQDVGDAEQQGIGSRQPSVEGAKADQVLRYISRGGDVVGAHERRGSRTTRARSSLEYHAREKRLMRHA